MALRVCRSGAEYVNHPALAPKREGFFAAPRDEQVCVTFHATSTQ
jgi:hypothetical protein